MANLRGGIRQRFLWSLISSVVRLDDIDGLADQLLGLDLLVIATFISERLMHSPTCLCFPFHALGFGAQAGSMRNGAILTLVEPDDDRVDL